MARERTSSRRSAKEAARRTKKKPCLLCRDKCDWVDYKDVALLRKYMSDRGKIRARRVSGNCAQHQREIALAIKTARELALLPYTQRTVTERSGGRGRGGRVPGGRTAVLATGDEGGTLSTDVIDDTDAEDADVGLAGVDSERAGTKGADSNGAATQPSDEVSGDRSTNKEGDTGSTTPDREADSSSGSVSAARRTSDEADEDGA